MYLLGSDSQSSFLRCGVLAGVHINSELSPLPPYYDPNNYGWPGAGNHSTQRSPILASVNIASPRPYRFRARPRIQDMAYSARRLCGRLRCGCIVWLLAACSGASRSAAGHGGRSGQCPAHSMPPPHATSTCHLPLVHLRTECMHGRVFTA
jgi:hypothetical protein